jgi:hypothetical protein
VRSDSASSREEVSVRQLDIYQQVRPTLFIKMHSARAET